MLCLSFLLQDMAQTTTLMNLVFSIFMAREAGRLRIEEELWRLLVRIYRRPRTLLDWTSLTLLKDYDSATLRFRCVCLSSVNVSRACVVISVCASS